MIERFFHWFRRITGISTPIGGISWSPSSSRAKKIPILRKPIYITYPQNHEVISFLKTNSGKIIFLDTHIDASVSILKQIEIVEEENINIDLITSSTFSGIALPLPCENYHRITISFYFTNDHVLKCSFGGTGIITVGIRGFFEISHTFHGGPSTAFHLKEVKSSLDAKVDMLNK